MRMITEFSGMKFLFRFRRQTGPTPYCLAHSRNKGMSDTIREIKFLKWCKRPNRACALYWRIHKEEYPWKIND